jgi:predicted lipoprotein with Yx(FWY)xxD motif
VGRHRKIKLGDWRQPWLRVAGAILLVVSAGIHLDLYLTGYRSIPTVGWLFLVQFLVAFVLAIGALVTHSRLVAVAGAAFALSTLGCYLLAVWIGLFGYKEIRTRAGIAAGLVLFGIALASAGGGGEPASAAGVRVALRTATIDGVTVLTSQKGFTLYWFAPDSAAASRCTGSCAAYWPPVIGTPTAGPGVTTSKLGTVKRPGGTTQATYAGHPLYTYVGDDAPGQARGNKIDLNGGYWYEVHA